jgi:hypothetical protein
MSDLIERRTFANDLLAYLYGLMGWVFSIGALFFASTSLLLSGGGEGQASLLSTLFVAEWCCFAILSFVLARWPPRFKNRERMLTFVTAYLLVAAGNWLLATHAGECVEFLSPFVRSSICISI